MSIKPFRLISSTSIFVILIKNRRNEIIKQKNQIMSECEEIENNALKANRIGFWLYIILIAGRNAGAIDISLEKMAQYKDDMEWIVIQRTCAVLGVGSSSWNHEYY